MGGDDDPPPGGGVNVNARVNSINNSSRRRSYSLSSAENRPKTQKTISFTQNKIQTTSKRVRDSPGKNNNNTTKQPTLNDYWLSNPQSSNRFSILDPGEDTEADEGNNSGTNSQSQPTTEPKPPPIYVSKVENIQPLRDLLEQITPNHYELKILHGDEVKIQSYDIDSFRLVTKALEEKNTEFHTFRPKQERTYNIVLKGIHGSTSIEEIKEEIELLGHEVINISNIKHRVSKHSLPMFFINLKQQDNNKEIFKCSSILHTKITIEPPRKKREIAQCSRCQRYGHTKRFCHHNPRCVKCSEGHLTMSCPRTTRSDSVKCVLCNGNHSANYKGCTIYKQLQEKSFPRLRPRTRPSESSNNRNETNQNDYKTYSDALKGRHSNSQNTNNPNNTTASSQQTNDMADLKAMMKTFMDQTTSMMNLLTKLISKLV